MKEIRLRQKTASLDGGHKPGGMIFKNRKGSLNVVMKKSEAKRIDSDNFKMANRIIKMRP